MLGGIRKTNSIMGKLIKNIIERTSVRENNYIEENIT